MKIRIMLAAALALSARASFAAEDLRGVIYMVLPSTATLYGKAQDLNNPSNNTFQVKICWDDPTFVNNCEAPIPANTLSFPFLTCSGAKCNGFNYVPPSGQVGSVTPRDGNPHLIYARIVSQANPGAGDKTVDGSPWPFTFTSGTVARMWPDNPQPAPARLQPSDIAVIANSSDPYSVGLAGNIVCTVNGIAIRDDGVAGYFMRRHNVPCANVAVVTMNVRPAISQSVFTSVLLPELKKLAPAIQGIALAWVQPSTVTSPSPGFSPQSISAVVARAGFETGTGCVDGNSGLLGQGPVNPYFNSISRAPFTDYGLRPTMMLAGESCATCTSGNNYAFPWTADFSVAKGVIDAAVAAVDTNPAGGNVDWAWTSNTGQSQTAILVSPLLMGSGLSPKVQAQVLGSLASPTPKVVSARNILLYDQSEASWTYNSPSFVPGAGVAFSVTSTSGNLPSDGIQTNAASWLNQGAVAAYGNAVEPCELAAYKHPDPAVLVSHYLAGQTILEAMWKSVRLPWGGNFVGDPLAAPFTLGVATAGGPSLSAVLDSASYSAGPLAPGSIVSLFGGNLASQTLIANSLPLPSSLGGSSMSLVDSLGQSFAVPLFFVSPGQINFVVPAAQPGPGNLNIVTGGKANTLAVQIGQTHPGLFSADGTGTGVAVGNVLHMLPGGTESYGTLASCSANGCSPLPVKFSVPGERIFIVLYGTGFRNVASLSGVSVTIGGQSVTPAYAGAQGSLSGLDQINIEIPPSLSGMGTVPVQVSINGQAAKPLSILLP